MLFSTLNLLVLTLAAQASAKTIKIVVGKDGLAFSPNTTTAEKGDILEYHFYKQHSVAMGDFANGCTPASQGGFFSGVMKTSGTGPNVSDRRPFLMSVLPMYYADWGIL
jgi:plastocyanin